MKSCELPTKITAGLTFEARLALPAYPANLWTAQLMLRGAKAITLTAVADGNDYVLRAPATETSGWPAGTYAYTLRVSSGGDVFEAGSGQITILPDLSTVPDGYDSQTEAQRALAAIDAVMAKRATLDQERYRINNRELYRTPIRDLIKLRSFYALQVQRELAAACGKNPFGRKVRVSLR